MKKIEQEMNKLAKGLSILSKSQARERSELRNFYKTILKANPAALKKAVAKLDDEDQKLVGKLLQSAMNDNSSVKPTPHAEPHFNFDLPEEFPVYDKKDEELMDYSMDRVKHQGDNHPLGFDGQVVADYEEDNDGLLKNPGQEKGKLKGEDLGEYEPANILDYENEVKDQAENNLDQAARQSGMHRTILPIENKDVAKNKEVRKEWKEKEDKMKKEQMKKASSVSESDTKPPTNAMDVPNQRGPMGSQAFIKHAAPGVDKEKFDRCVEDVKKKGEKVNPYAVCNASLKKNEMQDKIKNTYTNWEEQDHALDKSDSDLDIKNEINTKKFNTFHNFDQQISRWREVMDKEEKEMKEQKPDMLKSDEVNVEFQPKMSSEMQQREKNKYTNWEKQNHPEANKQNEFLSEMYEDVKKAMFDLQKKYIGFKKLKEELSHKKGVTNPGAVAAAIGRKKYGKEQFQHMAAEGKKEAKKSESVNEIEPGKSSIENMNGVKRNSSVAAKSNMSDNMNEKMCKCKQCMLKSQIKKHQDDLSHAKELLRQMVGNVDHELSEAMEEKMHDKKEEKHLEHENDENKMEMHKAQEDYVGERPKMEYEKDKNALVLKSNIAEETKKESNPNKKQEMWGKHWGYDWKIRPIARTASGKVIYVNRDPQDEAYSSKDHEEAATILRRLHEKASNDQSIIAHGGMEMNKEIEESIRHHEKMLEHKKQMENKLHDNLERDLKQPKENKLGESPSFEKSLSETLKGTQLAGGYKTGRNVTYKVSEMIEQAYANGQKLQKSKWLNEAKVAQNPNKISINDLLEQRLDLSTDQVKKAIGLQELTAKKNFTVKSFSDEDMVKELRLPVEVLNPSKK